MTPPQVLCVVHAEVFQLVEEAVCLAEEEEGGLDVKHGVKVLEEKLLLILHFARGKFRHSLEKRNLKSTLINTKFMVKSKTK